MITLSVWVGVVQCKNWQLTLTEKNNTCNLYDRVMKLKVYFVIDWDKMKSIMWAGRYPTRDAKGIYMYRGWEGDTGTDRGCM